LFTLSARGLVEIHLRQREIADADAIGGVGPIDEDPAPDHERQEREVDPVKPADRQWVLLFQSAHASLDAAPQERLQLGVRWLQPPLLDVPRESLCQSGGCGRRTPKAYHGFL
jgi:hypothetical protein